MTLNKKSRLVRYYFWLMRNWDYRDQWRRWEQTDLCHLVRTVVLGTLGFAIMASLVSFAVIGVGIAIYENPLAALGIASAIVAALSIIFLVGRHGDKVVIQEWLRAKKGRYCPIVTFKEDQTRGRS